MMRVAAAVVLLGAVAVYGQAPRPVPRTGTSAIRGRVLDSSGSNPLRNARVQLELNDQPYSTVLTDRDGRFAAVNLPAGRYRLVAAKPGYVKTTLNPSIGAARRIDIIEGATVEG